MATLSNEQCSEGDYGYHSHKILVSIGTGRLEPHGAPTPNHLTHDNGYGYGYGRCPRSRRSPLFPSIRNPSVRSSQLSPL